MGNELNKTYYDILNVPYDASFSLITESKNNLKYGPVGVRLPFAMWDSIDKAYSVLSDPEKRKNYDESIKPLIVEKKKLESMMPKMNVNSFKDLPKMEVMSIPKVVNIEPVNIVKPKQTIDITNKLLNKYPIVQFSIYNKKYKLNNNKFNKIFNIKDKDMIEMDIYYNILIDQAIRHLKSKYDTYLVNSSLDKCINCMQLVVGMMDQRESSINNSFTNRLKIISLKQELRKMKSQYKFVIKESKKTS